MSSTAKGPGRSAGPTSIRLTQELSEFLRAKATQNKTSVASIIVQLVTSWKEDEEQRVWQGHVDRFCDECKPHLVDLLYRKEPTSGKYQRRYDTPPLADLDAQ